MNLIIIFFIAVGLAMDACVISISKGMVHKTTLNQALIIALLFGVFQGGMTIIGWLLGIPIKDIVSTFAPWIAFILISIIGIKMIYESFLEDDTSSDFSLREISILAIATSIDAFVVGISFAIINTPVINPAIIIGVITFILSFIGVYLGKRLGHLFGKEIEILGGIILIGIGLFILIGY
jgi:manganese efflux pump family protein